MSLNTVCIMGRLTADPELRHTLAGVPVCTFRVAISRDFKDKDGERGTDFMPVVCWRSTAEFASRYFRKGQLVVVKGRLQNREYTDKQDNKHTITEIIAENAYSAESRVRESTEQTYPNGDTEQTYPPGGNFTDVEDDNLPF